MSGVTATQWGGGPAFICQVGGADGGEKAWIESWAWWGLGEGLAACCSV